MATTSMLCLSLFVYNNTTLLELQTLLFLFFFQNLRFQIGGAAYCIHGRLRYPDYMWTGPQMDIALLHVSIFGTTFVHVDIAVIVLGF